MKINLKSLSSEEEEERKEEERRKIPSIVPTHVETHVSENSISPLIYNNDSLGNERNKVLLIVLFIFLGQTPSGLL